MGTKYTSGVQRFLNQLFNAFFFFPKFDFLIAERNWTSRVEQQNHSNGNRRTSFSMNKEKLIKLR